MERAGRGGGVTSSVLTLNKIINRFYIIGQSDLGHDLVLVCFDNRYFFQILMGQNVFYHSVGGELYTPGPPVKVHTPA